MSDESDVVIEGFMMAASEDLSSPAELAAQLDFEVWAPQPWPAGLPAPHARIMRWPDGGIDYDISPPPPLEAKDPMTARHMSVSGQASTSDRLQELDGAPVWDSTSHSLLCRVVRGTTEIALSFRAFSRDEAEAVVTSLQQVPPPGNRT